ncbi:MAG: cystathionine beta-synthase [Vampirovibrio sp.]|nr:cystathionine beta-synthase [Vampirovibrio sp.]
MPMTSSLEPKHVPAHYQGICDSITDAIGHTPLVRLHRMFSEFPNTTVLAKVEYVNPNGSMKDRIALRMIERAEQEGRIKPGDTLVEPTSGNTGLGLAMVCAAKGYKLVITMPMKMSEEKRRLIRAFGAELILAPTELAHDHPDNYIEVAKRIARERPNAHMLNQYENPGNPEAHYLTTGPEIWEQTQGQFDYFVCGMGTGGTITGTSRYLKEQNPNIKIIGADPLGSIFSGGEAGQYLVEGIGYDFWPKVFDVKLVDEMFTITDKESFAEARRIAKEEGMLVGGSSGTVLASTRKLLQSHDLSGKTVVIMLHDSGRSYLTKIYNDEWMAENKLL